MQSGLKRIVPHKADFSLHKTFGSVVPLTFSDSLNIDAGLWCPNQNTQEPIFNNPALPEGCTDYCQTDLCIDEDGTLHNPILLENVVHANANGGADIRVSLSAAIQVFNRSAYFTVHPYNGLDFFDAIRLAIMSGIPEKRSVSIGTPWYVTAFESVDSSGIIKAPDNWSTAGLPWHNWKICGWKTINGVPYLIGKSWQGTSYGDQGYVYFSRGIINQIMSIWGTGAFTLTKMSAPGQIVTVDWSLYQRMKSFILTLMNYFY